MKIIRNMFRIWVYGMGIALYTVLILVVTTMPIALLVDTLGKTLAPWIEVPLRVLAAVIAPILFGWMFYILIGRRLKWHDLKSKMEE